MSMKERLKWILSGVVGVVIGGAMVWAYMGKLVETCHTDLSSKVAYAEAQERFYADSLKAERDRTQQAIAAQRLAEREVGQALAQRIQWHTQGNGPLDLPSLTPEEVKKRLIPEPAQAKKISMPVEMPVERVEPDVVASPTLPISQQLTRVLGAKTMQAIRGMVRP